MSKVTHKVSKHHSNSNKANVLKLDEDDAKLETIVESTSKQHTTAAATDCDDDEEQNC